MHLTVSLQFFRQGKANEEWECNVHCRVTSAPQCDKYFFTKFIQRWTWSSVTATCSKTSKFQTLFAIAFSISSISSISSTNAKLLHKICHHCNHSLFQKPQVVQIINNCQQHNCHHLKCCYHRNHIYVQKLQVLIAPHHRYDHYSVSNRAQMLSAHQLRFQLNSIRC